MTLFYFIILSMTLLYSFMFLVILFLVYYDYILGIVRSESYPCLGSYSVYPPVLWVNDRYCVGMVPRPYLSAIVPYIPDREVDRGSDSPIESFVVLLPFVGQAEQFYYGGMIAMFFNSLVILTMHEYLFSRHDCQV